MELRVLLDDKFASELSLILGLNQIDVAKEAYTILYWIVKERLKGRVILSSDSDGQNTTRLAMKSLDNLTQ